MDGKGPLFQPRAALQENGDCPFAKYLASETDARVRALILNKVAYLARVRPEDYSRPLIDTLEGPIKEIRFGPNNSLRLLFSLEQDVGAIVVYGGERKKKGPVSQSLIEEAQELREIWVANGLDEAIDVDDLRDKIARRRLGWPQ